MWPGQSLPPANCGLQICTSTSLSRRLLPRQPKPANTTRSACRAGSASERFPPSELLICYAGGPVNMPKSFFLRMSSLKRESAPLDCGVRRPLNDITLGRYKAESLPLQSRYRKRESRPLRLAEPRSFRGRQQKPTRLHLPSHATKSLGSLAGLERALGDAHERSRTGMSWLRVSRIVRSGTRSLIFSFGSLDNLSSLQQPDAEAVNFLAPPSGASASWVQP